MNRLNVVCLGVKDMERAIRFYKDGLGFQTKETSYTPPVIFFNTSAGIKLELFPLDLLAKDINSHNPPPVGTGFSGITLAYNAKSREEVHQIMELAKKAGAKVEKEPQEVFWGGYHAYFSDLDGYYWEVAYGPDFSFDENDMLLL
ncbi:VOC family protein [Lacrimispora saccharolytica]|uniref:Glyoxalase/bleomycin resistance protein/dioxygenase n=1 Tax=Lacrimispora saccharolytica (strain ATCC 35040 / DSM 2544 / NRCC 2533 / WM1) TaxID=610130 RepID=D9R1N7_LACSW|nr:VOC family protein [Lacrimispora saccharolytica]ADL06560.1 Glyoxalase/bleomycin resistance protein/dioxygenase [[Clostridium] saccharolyticum WM1]QRV19363.1 VOC family protein [Lacrimispora saccharolytica]